MSTNNIREELDMIRRLLKEDVENAANPLSNSNSNGLQAGDDIQDSSDNAQNQKSLEAIPYGKNDELLNSITQSCKQQFGASFTKSKTPMLYYPKDGDVTLTGEIGTLNNAVFQFRYKDVNGNGCYVWLEPIHISDETLKVLSVVNGVYKNWKNELATSEDIKPMSMRDEGVLGGSTERQVTPGDDLD